MSSKTEVQTLDPQINTYDMWNLDQQKSSHFLSLLRRFYHVAQLPPSTVHLPPSINDSASQPQ